MSFCNSDVNGGGVKLGVLECLGRDGTPGTIGELRSPRMECLGFSTLNLPSNHTGDPERIVLPEE